MLKLLLLLLLCLAIKSILAQTSRQLVYVQAIWRHGDRAPTKLPYPKDANTETAWPRGWAQMTNLGMKELYDLGSFFRRRYSSYVGTDFDMKKVTVISTNSERAIVSAQAMLRGFFPASGKFIWLDNEPWQPLPFYTRTFGDSDPMLRPTDWECSLYDKVADEQNSEIFNSLNKEYADLFTYLQNVTGFEKVDADKAASLNNIQREIIHGMPQPEWVYKRWPAHGNRTTLEIVAEIKRITRISDFNSPEKSRLRGGLLLGDWLNRAINVSLARTVEPQKMMLYSTHDGTVSSLMYAMNIGDNQLIPYAACLIMEVYRTSDNATDVKILYKNQTYSDAVGTITIPGCQDPCPIENLSKLLTPQTLSSEEELATACCAGITDGVCSNGALGVFSSSLFILPFAYILLSLFI